MFWNLLKRNFCFEEEFKGFEIEVGILGFVLERGIFDKKFSKTN